VDRYVCYKGAEECGDSYLKMDTAVFLDDDLKVQPAFATAMVTNRKQDLKICFKP
jgi:hypothetical protein